MSLLQSKLDKKIMDVLVSPCRIDLLNNLINSDGIKLEDITNKMVTKPVDINKHLNKLIENEIIRLDNGRYYLTNDGKRLYKILQQIVVKSGVV